jgi:hypothetical protein
MKKLVLSAIGLSGAVATVAIADPPVTTEKVAMAPATPGKAIKPAELTC